jgi:hypothetical protein
MTADVSGATPGGLVAVAFGFNATPSTVPAGPCGVLTVGISNPLLLALTPADAAGNLSVSGNAGAVACGGYVQAADISTCSLSNVAPLTPAPSVTFDFPSALSQTVGSVGFGVGPGGEYVGYYWDVNRGDMVSETFAGPASITSYQFDCEVLNNLNGGAQCDWDVVINGTVVDSFTVVIGQLTISEGGSFAAVNGPNYTVELKVTNTVFPGGGSNALRYTGVGPHQITLQ